MKKMKIAMAAGTVVFALSACGQTENTQEMQQDAGSITIESMDDAEQVQETQTDDWSDTDSAVNAGEKQPAAPKDDVQEKKDSVNSAGIPEWPGQAASDEADSEMTAEELLDLFINGSINAVDPADLTSAFYITDLNMDSKERDSYSVGEKVDLDNDGENELVMNGPYGGIYLDARDNKVYEFAAAEGTALVLSYTYYNGEIWIMYSNRSSAGFEYYHMEKFEGADNLAAEMNFGEELIDPEHAELGLTYTLNETEISYEEYTALCSKIFAAEVNTN